jgi:hypothetical protein
MTEFDYEATKQQECYERILKKVPYPVSASRVVTALDVIHRCMTELTSDDIAGALGECGMWACITWEDIGVGKLSLHLTDLQMVAAAAALSSALDGLRNAPIPIMVEPNGSNDNNPVF